MYDAVVPWDILGCPSERELLGKLTGAPDFLPEAIRRIEDRLAKDEKSLNELALRSSDNVAEFCKFFDRVKSRMGLLLTQIDTVDRQLHAPQTGIKNKVKEAKYAEAALGIQLESNASEIGALEVLQQAYEARTSFDDCFSRLEFLKCVALLSTLESGLRQRLSRVLPDESIAISKLVQNDWQDKRIKLQNRVCDLSGKMVIVSRNKIESHTSREFPAGQRVARITFNELWSTLSALDCVPKVLKSMADNMLREGFLTLFQAKVGDVSIKEAANRAIFLFVISEKEPIRSSEQFVGVLRGRLFELVKFLQKHVFSGRGDLLKQFGEETWAAMCEACLKDSLLDSISDAKPDALDALKKQVSRLEPDLTEAGYIEASTRPLTAFVEDLDTHYAERRKQRLITEAKHLCISECTETTLPPALLDGKEASGGRETPRMMESPRTVRAQVSTRIVSFLSLIRQSLDEACNTSPKCAESLVIGVKESLGLYHTVIPTCHGDLMEKIPFISMVFYNDCNYLASQLSTLGVTYRSRLPMDLAPKASFLEMIPSVRQVANVWLGKMMRSQHEELAKFLDEIGGFRNASVGGKAGVIDLTFKQMVHHLTTLSKVSREVLPQNVYIGFVAQLIDALLAKITAQVQSLKDIGAEDSEILHRVLTPLPDKLLAAASASLGESVAEFNAISAQVPSLVKYRLLAEMMDLPIAEIVSNFELGKLSCFSVSEVRSLISSLFEGPNLKSALEKIK